MEQQESIGGSTLVLQSGLETCNVLQREVYIPSLSTQNGGPGLCTYDIRKQVGPAVLLGIA
jgi:hypothetical protein